MTYQSLNSTAVESNIMYLFVYANEVTNGWFGTMFLLSFMTIIFIGSMVTQQRISQRIRPDVSLLVSSFATLGLATILEQVSGIISPFWFMSLIGIFIIALIWTLLSE